MVTVLSCCVSLLNALIGCGVFVPPHPPQAATASWKSSYGLRADCSIGVSVAIMLSTLLNDLMSRDYSAASLIGCPRVSRDTPPPRKAAFSLATAMSLLLMYHHLDGSDAIALLSSCINMSALSQPCSFLSSTPQNHQRFPSKQNSNSLEPYI